MKTLSTLFLLAAGSAWATETPPSLCGADSTRTSVLVLSTGINAAVSDTALYASGYGGNSYYIAPNTNTDAYWVISRLSSSYTTRGSAPLAYNMPYLQVGSHPYVIKTSNWTPVSDHWASYTSSTTCDNAPVTTQTVSHWVSVYSDAGGQNPTIANQPGDPYVLQRCFRTCTTDSFSFSLRLMADDIIDSVWVDNKMLYSATGNAGMGYSCSASIGIFKTVALSPGRHWLRVAFRDNLGGHVGMNVQGTVAAKKGAYLVKSQYAGACSLQDDVQTDSTRTPSPNPPQSVAATQQAVPVLAPNPNNGSFSVDVPEGSSTTGLVITSLTGGVVYQQPLRAGRNPIAPPQLVPGMYLVYLTGDGYKAVTKMLVQ